MHESLCYHHLFSFSSPSGAVRSQTRYHSLRPPPRPRVNTRLGNGIGDGEGRVRGLGSGGWGEHKGKQKMVVS